MPIGSLVGADERQSPRDEICRSRRWNIISSGDPPRHGPCAGMSRRSRTRRTSPECASKTAPDRRNGAYSTKTWDAATANQACGPARRVVWQAVPVVIAREDEQEAAPSEFVEIGRHLPRPLRVDEWAGLGAGHFRMSVFRIARASRIPKPIREIPTGRRPTDASPIWPGIWKALPKAMKCATSSSRGDLRRLLARRDGDGTP